MAKPDRSNLTNAAHLNEIFQAGLQDLATYLDHRDVDALQRLLSDSRGCLNYVTEELARTDCTASFVRYSALRQLEALLKKNVDLPGTSAQSRKAKALETFVTSERKCKRTNKRLAYYFSHPSRIPSGVREVLNLAQTISYEIFGPMTRGTFQHVIDCSGFGPGMTFSSKTAEDKHLYFKAAGPHSFTEDARPYVKTLLNHWPRWKACLIEEGSVYDVVRGNRVTTVAKTADTDRTIAIEPSLNVFLQKGIESHLTGRLRRFGVSLTNQERSQDVARLGSERVLYASTIDLSSASDTVSNECVRFFAPSLWYVLLNDLRAKEYTLDKGETWSRYEKFSSMGNAFTFPLESLVFFSVAKAASIFCGANLDVLRVYGDDIIIDPRAALLLLEVLEFLGFSCNRDKSFVFGCFKETCGADYLGGVDTRPVYVKNCPRNDQEAYNLFNRFLWTRSGIQMHNTCSYIHGLVRKPLYGPPDLAPGRNFMEWYAGKSVVYDHYFQAPPSYGERFKRWDPDLQEHVWNIQILRFKPKKVDASNWNLQFVYMAFLLGVRNIDKNVESVSRFRRTLPYELFVRWESPPWWPLAPVTVGLLAGPS